MEKLDDLEIFELVREVLMKPPVNILALELEAKSMFETWLHRRLMSTAGLGVLRTTKTILQK